MLEQLPGRNDAGRSAAAPTQLSRASPFPPCPDEVAGSGETFALNSACEPAVAVDPAGSRHQVVAWQQDRWAYGAARAAVFAVTRDGGQSWRPVVPKITVCSGGSYYRITNVWLSFGPGGRLHAAMMAIGGLPYEASIITLTSDDGGSTWSDTVQLASDPISGFFNDKPGITADSHRPGWVYLTWNHFDKGANTHSVMFSRSTDGGRTWDPARALHQPPPGEGTIGNQVIVLPDGTLIDIFHQGPFAPGAPSGQAHGSDQISAIRSTDGGMTWSRSSTIATVTPASPVLPGTAEPVAGAALVPGIAIDARGHIYVVWTDAGLTESTSAVALTVSSDGGRTWTRPCRVNATPDSPPGGTGQAFTPAVAASDGTIAITYYDLRDAGSAAPAGTGHWITTGPGDGCATTGGWTERRLGGPFDLSTAVRWFSGPYLGTYTGLAATRDGFVSAFVMSGLGAAGAQDVYLKQVSAP